jgi:hemerythrin
MAFFEWKDEYCVGVAELDEDHKVMVGLIDELYEAIHRDQHSQTMAAAIDEMNTLGRVLDDLVDYVENHSAAEEELMRQYSYPAYEEHKTAHETTKAKVRALKGAFEDGEAVSSRELVRFLKQWLTSHILDLDMRLGAFLGEQDLCEEAGQREGAAI